MTAEARAWACNSLSRFLHPNQALASPYKVMCLPLSHPGPLLCSEKTSARSSPSVSLQNESSVVGHSARDHVIRVIFLSCSMWWSGSNRSRMLNVIKMLRRQIKLINLPSGDTVHLWFHRQIVVLSAFTSFSFGTNVCRPSIRELHTKELGKFWTSSQKWNLKTRAKNTEMCHSMRHIMIPFCRPHHLGPIGAWMKMRESYPKDPKYRTKEKLECLGWNS